MTRRHLPVSRKEDISSPDHSDHLAARFAEAGRLASDGEYSAALEIFRSLVEDYVRLLGADHPASLRARRRLVECMFGSGDICGAVQLSTTLVRDHQRVLGKDDPATLAVRLDVAHWTGEGGDVVDAALQFVTLVNDCAKVLGADHLEALSARGALAYYPVGEPAGLHQGGGLPADPGHPPGRYRSAGQLAQQQRRPAAFPAAVSRARAATGRCLSS